MGHVKHNHWKNYFNVVASTKGYSNFAEWKRDHYQANQRILEYGWKQKLIDDCFPDDWKRKRQKWNFAKFCWIIKKLKIVSMRDWINKDKSSSNYFYRAIKRRELTEQEIVKIKKMIPSKIKKWTFEECYQIAKSCKTKIEWRQKSNLSYKCAVKHGWFKKCSAHMPIVAKADFKISEVFVDHPLFYKLVQSKLRNNTNIYYFNKASVLTLGIKINYKKDRPDFVVYNHINHKFLFIEIKKDKMKQSFIALKKQLERYDKEGEKNGIRFKGTFLFTKEGKLKGSLSSKQIELINKKLN
jgi:hypothetical protein